jgi:hypothetical protein
MSGRNRQLGLALRMRREARVISAQHRQLDGFYGSVAGALAGGKADAANAAFARFTDALDAHLALEGGLYFPALRGLRPALAPELAALEDEHQQLRVRLGAAARPVEACDCAAAAAALEALAAALADHEEREEKLLTRIQHPDERT